jgi:hypothetical protein
MVELRHLVGILAGSQTKGHDGTGRRPGIEIYTIAPAFDRCIGIKACQQPGREQTPNTPSVKG